MRAGRMDRRITIEVNTPGTNEFNEPVESWATLAVVWADYRPQRGDEWYQSEREVETEVARFFIRFRSDVSPLNRHQFDGKVWDIIYAREIGRKDGLELMCNHVL